jgi:hypothetical protein
MVASGEVPLALTVHLAEENEAQDHRCCGSTYQDVVLKRGANNLASATG